MTSVKETSSIIITINCRLNHGDAASEVFVGIFCSRHLHAKAKRHVMAVKEELTSSSTWEKLTKQEKINLLTEKLNRLDFWRQDLTTVYFP